MTRAEAARLVSVGAARWDGDVLVYCRPVRPLSCDATAFGLVPCDAAWERRLPGNGQCGLCAWCRQRCATVRFMDESDDEPDPTTVRRRTPGGRLDVEDDDTKGQRDDRKDDKERRRG